jgi:death-on-curing protein
MIKFSIEKVLILYQLLKEETGGAVGVRDFGLLDSALESVFQTYDGIEFNPNEEEVTRVGFGIS